MVLALWWWRCVCLSAYVHRERQAECQTVIAVMWRLFRVTWKDSPQLPFSACRVATFSLLALQVSMSSHNDLSALILTLILTSGYATWFTAGGAIRIAHYDVIDDVIIRKLIDREKRRPPRPMKSSELSNVKTASLYDNFYKTGNHVIYDVIIWVQDRNCKKWLQRILVLVRSTI